MVHLSKIYTKSGDDGSTGLGDGSRRSKHDLRIEAYGTVDETSSVLGVAVALLESDISGEPRADVSKAVVEVLRHAQNDLFDVGADLCVPGEDGAKLRITAVYTERLERWIDEFNARLKPLNTFVLPGGALVAAYMHQARTVCRRAERCVSVLAAHAQDGKEAEDVNVEVLRYLNRLSDLLFVLARVLNDDGKRDVLWSPGETQKDGEDASS